ncbi:MULTISPECIES: thiolase family protein [Sphingobacterium]|jgi:acetyl-CoA C-acetyltransferase|uniref:acetyl-CoA C-acetyltransferase n=1 Tax=Sphingobacterium multivorum TaxID=28454 RepID=A0A2X2K2N1_SPHMU|nr:MULTISPECIES: thiolase family protein [Sphingobacterium]HBI90061.1 acetyl-CoA C-acetyltransferase [Sphingobacterium sp.]MDF2851286.1 acetyl-CoA acetyltransferase [Sphingobacterium multivorum]QQT46340.1 thiolase family protein [Sphingobacterium multivorum]QQT61117.1 thiolase family protein [Sphingobacterium multivorum]QRQ62841.1 thiolase family protein [Sphingobacterium multivorum]
MSKSVFIVAAKRTPIGSFGGALSSISATKLAARVVRAVVDEAGIASDLVDEIIMGAVLQADLGQAPARQVARFAGLSDHTTATTINKVCASGMKAIAVAAQSILLGDADVVIAGGMESMSRVPYYADAMRWGAKFGAQSLSDGLQRDGLSDAYSNDAMGVFAELCAEKYHIGREEQDNYAISSYKRSLDAWQKNKFLSEVQPITVQSRKGEVLVSRDEEFSQVNFDKIPELKPAFKKEGTVTAANASTISDGAAAVLLMSGEKLEELGLVPLAEIIAYADAEQVPEWFTTTPSIATNKVLKKAGLTIDDIDYFEFNEAFSVVALANAQILGLPLNKVNVYGGAVSLGHPLGCSGARIVVTLSSILRQEGGSLGLAAICNGGGGASAMVIKKI